MTPPKNHHLIVVVQTTERDGERERGREIGEGERELEIETVGDVLGLAIRWLLTHGRTELSVEIAKRLLKINKGGKRLLKEFACKTKEMKGGSEHHCHSF